MKIFERTFTLDKALWEEESNAYFYYYDKEWFCRQILEEFGLDANMDI